jgi:hypothetical protein
MFAAHKVAAFSVLLLKASNFEYKTQLKFEQQYGSNYVSVVSMTRDLAQGVREANVPAEIPLTTMKNKLLQCNIRLDPISI